MLSSSNKTKGRFLEFLEMIITNLEEEIKIGKMELKETFGKLWIQTDGFKEDVIGMDKELSDFMSNDKMKVNLIISNVSENIDETVKTFEEVIRKDLESVIKEDDDDKETEKISQQMLKLVRDRS
ncbi:hypothetical protein C1645_820731 [Glomus cerebriforme]|uniref:Uncharacterized protein n=1 Tax=Glomus cerebriforme TaxID=658196 RepID=A0A397TBX0_9GLOM|nr:hypothetical protein C1645_820731 [Glomus cerebriforme]